MTNPILQLEVNEISWRFLRAYLGDPHFPNINMFFGKAKSLTSVVVDGGEMSPWVVWPTLHRGMNENHHLIRNLGQDPRTFLGTPIWDEVRASGESIGVFGPLQSWPPRDPGPGGFYVPDTFAHDEHCFPAELEPLQKMNLALVGKNVRVRSGGLLSAVDGKALRALWRSPVRWKTLARVVGQLVREKFDSRYCARRSIFQNILFWDVFRGLYDFRNPPAYSSYFSNHLASAMHRYWNYQFPQDFPEELKPRDSFHKGTLHFAMKVLDEMLGDALYWMKENPNLTVIVATGLGQDTVVRNRHEGTEMIVADPAKLMAALGLGAENYRRLLAMMPQTAFEIADHTLRLRVKEKLEELQFASGARAFFVDEVGDTLSVSLANPPRRDCRSAVFVRGGELIPFAQLGCSAIQIEPGTAYHIPEAIFAVAGPGAARMGEIWKDERIPGDKIKETVLSLLELPSRGRERSA